MTERRIQVAGCELVITCDGALSLPDSYDAYSGIGAPPCLRLHVKRTGPLDEEAPVGPDHPAFQWSRAESGRVWLSRVDAQGWVDVPADLEKEVSAEFSVSDSLHSLEAVLRICASIASLMKSSGTPEKGKIFNSPLEPKADAPAKASRPEPKKETKVTEDDDDDWGAVPAFLRRSRLK